MAYYRRSYRPRMWGGFRSTFRRFSFRRRGVKFLSFRGFKTYAFLLAKLAIVAFVILFIYRLIKQKGSFMGTLRNMPVIKPTRKEPK